jgi:hypothetical protein
LMLNAIVAAVLLVGTAFNNGTDDSFDTAALVWVETALLDSMASVVSVVALATSPVVLPEFVLVGVVDPFDEDEELLELELLEDELVCVPHETLVSAVVQPVVRLSSVLLTQPVSAEETANNPKPNKIRMRLIHTTQIVSKWRDCSNFTLSMGDVPNFATELLFTFA